MARDYPDWFPGALAAQDAYQGDYPPPEGEPRARITVRPQEDMPPDEAVFGRYPAPRTAVQYPAGSDPEGKTARIMGGIADIGRNMLDLPRQAFEQSENLRKTGEYDPEPVLGAALWGVSPSFATSLARPGTLGVAGGRPPRIGDVADLSGLSAPGVTVGRPQAAGYRAANESIGPEGPTALDLARQEGYGGGEFTGSGKRGAAYLDDLIARLREDRGVPRVSEVPKPGEVAALDRLPMDQASRMARAAEQGYTIDAYKGMYPYDWRTVPERDWKGNVIAGADRIPQEITSFNAGKALQTTPGAVPAESRGAGFFSNSPDVASRFATAMGEGAVYPVKLKMQNPKIIDAEGRYAADFQFGREGNQLTLPKDSPHDGVILKNTKDEGDVYIPRASSQARSRFAAFDPAKASSDDLLAIQRQAVKRDPSGRPTQTAPLPIGIEQAILEQGYGMATGPRPPPGVEQPPLMQAAERKGPRMGEVADLTTPTGIRAYHGSPHDFERFDMSKIGTGEGAQVYGHGLYFAEAEPTALSYKNATRVTDMDWPVAGTDLKVPAWVARSAQTPRGLEEVRQNFVGRVEEAKQQLAAGDHNASERLYHTQRIVNALDAVKAGAPLKKPGHMYEVNINARPEQFLNWDKPLAEHPATMNEILNNLVTQATPKHFGQPLQDAKTSMRGSDLYTSLEPDAARSHPMNYRARTSEILKEAGIPGIRYLDQMSRGTADYANRLIPDVQRRIAYANEIGASPAAKEKLAAELAGYQAKLSEGTSNYVLFDDKLIDILRKYGIAGMLGGGAAAMGSTARQDQYAQ